MYNLLTIVFPIHKRYLYLNRLLTYLSNQFSSTKIILLDDTPEDQLPERINLVNKYKNALNINHIITSLHLHDKICEGLSRVDTPFVAIGADDDFYVPPTMLEGVQFLSYHNDYSIVHGYSLTFETANGSISNIFEYPQPNLEANDPALRFMNHLPNYIPTYYSIHRTQQCLANFLRTKPINNDLNFGELLPSCLSVIQGKVKKLPGLFMIRQRYAPKEYTLDHSMLTWITDPNWSRFHDYFVQVIIKELVNTTDFNDEELAKGIATSSLWEYIRIYLQPLLIKSEDQFRDLRKKISAAEASKFKNEGLTQVNLRSKIKQNIQIKSKKIMTLLSKLSPPQPPKNLLSELLKTENVHHINFMPIYECINDYPVDE